MQRMSTARETTARGPEVSSRQIFPLLAGYWAFGQYWGVWVILVFDFNRLHDLTFGQNGLLLTVLSASAVLVMALLAPRLQGLSLNMSVPISLISLAVGSIAMVALPSSAIWLAFVLVGLGNGLIDVYMNVAAQRVETRIRRPVLQWMHASYALGGVTGASLAGTIRTLDVDFRLGFVVTALALLATALPNRNRGIAEPGKLGGRAVFSLSAFRRHRALWVPAMIILSAFLVEGSMDTWSGLYLQEQLGAPPAAAAAAFTGFSASLFLGRLFAGRALFGLGPRRTVLIAGVGAAIGGTVAALSDSTLVVGGAFLVMGFAISAAAPAGFSLVEEIPGSDATSAVTAVTTIGYTGFVWSPPIYGWIADSFSLRAAMIVIVSATLGIVISGLFARGRR
jgi:MFS family permease